MKPYYGSLFIYFTFTQRVLNSCTVKDPSETVFRNYIAEAKQKGKMVVVAGCVPQGWRDTRCLTNSGR